MLTYYTDRYPKISGALIVLMTTIVPMLFVFATTAIFGEDFPSAHIIIALAFVMQLVLSFGVERMILSMIPFIVTLFGVLICEGLYLAVQVTAQVAATRVMLGYTLLSLGVSAFAPEFVGVVCGLILYAVISIVRSFLE